jgi:hypothetical protein
MRTFVASLAVVLALGAFAMSDSGEQASSKPQPESGKLLRHVVMFKFKPDAKPEQIRKVEQAFAALPSKIDAIHDLEWGTNNSPEMHDKGFTHVFLVTFKSEEARAEYLPHPEHQKFVEVLKPILEDVFVLDYWSQE